MEPREEEARRDLPPRLAVARALGELRSWHCPPDRRRSGVDRRAGLAPSRLQAACFDGDAAGVEAAVAALRASEAPPAVEEEPRGSIGRPPAGAADDDDDVLGSAGVGPVLLAAAGLALRCLDSDAGAAARGSAGAAADAAAAEERQRRLLDRYQRTFVALSAAAAAAVAANVPAV